MVCYGPTVLTAWTVQTLHSSWLESALLDTRQVTVQYTLNFDTWPKESGRAKWEIEAEADWGRGREGGQESTERSWQKEEEDKELDTKVRKPRKQGKRKKKKKNSQRVSTYEHFFPEPHCFTPFHPCRVQLLKALPLVYKSCPTSELFRKPPLLLVFFQQLQALGVIDRPVVEFDSDAVRWVFSNIAHTLFLPSKVFPATHS